MLAHCGVGEHVHKRFECHSSYGIDKSPSWVVRDRTAIGAGARAS